LKLRGTLQPATSAGTNFHLATVDRTDLVSVGCVGFTTVNVFMLAKHLNPDFMTHEVDKLRGIPVDRHDK